MVRIEKKIFWGTLLIGFVLQTLLRVTGIFHLDHLMWSSQIQYYLSHDIREFDFYTAYGHPGGTVIELGVLFSLIPGCSYNIALAIGISLLIATATAGCTVLCFVLHRNTYWWFAAACTLLINRMYLNATPPTAGVMPLIVFIILFAWWLWETDVKHLRRLHFLLGAVMGIAAATRLDCSLLVNTSVFIMLCYRYGRKVALPTISGAVIGFIGADPFMWFMPVQHIQDLIHKFTMHYAHFRREKDDPVFFADALWLSAMSVIFWLILLRQRLKVRVIPLPVMMTTSGISVIAIAVIFLSKFGTARYLFPLIIVWEVYLPLFIIKLLDAGRVVKSIEQSTRTSIISPSLIVLVCFVQIAAYLSI